MHLIAGDRMRVLDSTRPELGDDEALRIAAHTRGDPVWGLERFRVSEAAYRTHLRETRHRGYGARISRFVGETAFDDGLAAIACPIYAGPRLMGAISLLWAKGYMETEPFAERYLSHLQQATRRITRLLSAEPPLAVMRGASEPVRA